MNGPPFETKMTLVREPGGPDGRGRESFSMFWRDVGNERNRGQCFHAVVADYLGRGAIECATEEEAKREAGWVKP